MYTLREFRAHTKQAFDDAREGHEVIINRNHVEKFQLIALVDKPLPGHQMESKPGEKATLKPDSSYYLQNPIQAEFTDFIKEKEQGEG